MLARLPQDILAAAITAAVAITYSLSYGALIFSGPLGPELAAGISMMLVTAAISGIVVALTSSFRFAIGGSDSNATAVLATIAASIAEVMPNDPALAAHHVVLVLMLSSAVGGLILVVLGRYRMGRFIRFIPYPIVAGFLAATGWLLLNGSLRVIAAVSLPAHLERAFTPGGAARLLVGFAFAAVLFATRRIKHPLLLPALLLGAGVAVTGTLALTGSLAASRADGWLVSAFSGPQLSSIALPSAYAGISWKVVAELGPAIATAITVTILGILFGAAGLEVETGDDADLDRELRSSGFASIASALGGGSLGTLALNRSILNLHAGAQTRLAGVLVGVASLAALAGGSSIVALVPRPILGGLLLYLGFSLLLEWLTTAWRHLSRSDLLLVATIIVVTAVSSFFMALVIGLLFSCVSFVVRYSRFGAVRYALTAQSKRSRVERAQLERRELEAHGGAIRMLILQGYVFFGTANAVLEHGRRYLQPESPDHARYLIVDFAGVTGLDSSAANSFAKLTALGRRAGTDVIFCSLSATAHDVLVRAADPVKDAKRIIFVDLDHALEWCEDQLLESVVNGVQDPVHTWLAHELGSAEHADAFLEYFDAVHVPARAALFRQGDPSDSLFIVESGRLSVSVKELGRDRRLRSMIAGSFIGEMGLFSNEPRSADVHAEVDAALLRLSQAALARMGEEQPKLADAFLALLFRLQADRLRFANAEIAALEE